MSSSAISDHEKTPFKLDIFPNFLPIKIGVIFLNVSARFNCLATRQPSGNWKTFIFRCNFGFPLFFVSTVTSFITFSFLANKGFQPPKS